MCGRYALALRPSQVRQLLRDADMDVYDLPPDEGPSSSRQSYNFAPGYYGMVYRADVPDWGAGPRREHNSSRSRGRATGDAETAENAAAANERDVATDEPTPSPAEDTETNNWSTSSTTTTTQYKLQAMKWGLVPFWTKRNPDYASMLRTINCRDDSLATPGGMWATMKARKRCIVIAQGFFEWLKPGGPSSKEKIPHYIKRKDGQLMCFAGLWDCVIYDDGKEARGEDGDAALAGEDDTRKHYTYTIITTDSNAQLKFLHDRMPVILEPGSEALRVWLDPGRYEWTRELQALLKPFQGELEIYPVSKEVGKVGNNSQNFIIPVASRENKSNIANFFANAKGGAKAKTKPQTGEKVQPEVEVQVETTKPFSSPAKTEIKTVSESLDQAVEEAADDSGITPRPSKKGVKREAETTPSSRLGEQRPPAKRTALEPPTPSPTKGKLGTPSRAKVSATSNGTKSPAKPLKADGSQKITKFFANSA